MSLACALCSAAEGPVLNLTTSTELREHLIQDHSSTVARSLLSPRMTHNDRWLWSLVALDGAMEDIPKCSDEELHAASFDLLRPVGDLVRTFMHIALLNNDDFPEEQRVHVENFIERYFPTSATKQIEEDAPCGENAEDDEDQQPSINPILDLISSSIQMSCINNDVDFAQTHDGFEEEDDDEMSDPSPDYNANDLLCQLLGTQNLNNNEDNIVRSTFSKRPIADSKAVRTATCQSCHKKVCMTARQRHVYMAHVNKKDMFMCPDCDYSNSNSIWEARKHCESHGPNVHPVSNEKKYVKIIRAYNAMCFPNWREKKFAIMEEQLTPEEMDQAEHEASTSVMDNMNFAPVADDGSEAAGDDALTAILNKVEREMFDESVFDQSDSIDDQPPLLTSQRRRNANHQAQATTSSNASESGDQSQQNAIPADAVVDRHVCRKCGLECRYPGRHIVQKHLGKPLYVCPVCETFGTYEACAVGKHIESVHKRCDLKPISKMEEYASELRQLQTECFPDRQMKLVPSSLGSKPRERHICKLCEADVAQSDRQRHVYHRHLKQPKLFECPICDFHSDYDIHRVSWHIKWTHKNNLKQPITHEAEFRDTIDKLNEECFPGWKHRKSLAAQEEKMALLGKVKGEKNGYGTPNRFNRESSQVSSSPSEGTSRRSRRDLEADSVGVSALSFLDLLNEQSNDEDGPPTLLNMNRKRPALREMDSVNSKKPKAAKKEDEVQLYCEQCRTNVPESDELSHLMQEHLGLDLYKCPVCKTFTDTEAESVSQHMRDVHKNTVGAPLLNVENVDEILAEHKAAFPDRNLVMDKWQPGSGVQCKECGMLMKTEDRQIHVYRHHLRKQDLYECLFCEFSHHACSSDVKSHMRHVHNQPDATPRANIEKYANEIDEWNARCFNGWINRRLPSAATKDFDRCRLCMTEVQQTSRHIAEVHMEIHLHQCPICDYGASEARLVRRHMKNYHEKVADKLEPIANVVARRSEFAAFHEKCFPGRPKRLSNIVISEEGRRTKCKECGKTISKKRRLDHLLECHLKKKVFKCSKCSFSSTFDRALVKQHVNDNHNEGDVISDVGKHAAKLEELCRKCFKDQEVNLNFDI